MTSWTTKLLLGAMHGAMLGATALLATTALPAQEAPVTTGVLLGVQGCGWESCGPPRTLWVVRQGDRVRLATQGRGLLVPRRDGFWWLGLEDGYSGAGPQDYDPTASTAECDSIVLGLKPPPDTLAETPMEEEEPDEVDDEPVRQGAMWTARADATGTAPLHVLRSTGYGRLRLRWVGSDAFAVSEHAVWYGAYERVTESYEEDIYRFAEFLRPREGDDRPETLEPAGEAFRRAERACRRAILGDMKDAEERADPDDRSRTTWTVRRTPTAWRMAPMLHVPWVVDEPREPCESPRGLGAALIGHDRVTIAWSAIKDVLPEATTAFQSPAGELLLVVQGSTLYAFLPRGGSPGAVVARIPLGGDVVMAQWAVAAHAGRWNREVPSLLAKGPPAFVPGSVAR